MKEKFMKVNKANIGFLKSICPRSAPHFLEMSYINANKYWTTLQIVDFPAEPNSYFLSGLVNSDNVIVMIDEDSVDTSNALEFLGANVDEKEQDISFKTKFADRFKSRKQMENSANFVRYVTDTKEKVKVITLRLFLFEKTQDRLQKLLDNLTQNLRELGLTGTIQTNDLESDFKAITVFDNPLKEMVPTGLVADMLMYRAMSMIKPGVSIVGTTPTGVYADDYASYKYSSFCTMFFGVTGSGKSSLIKSIIEDGWLHGDISYLLDIHAQEYKALADKYNITSVSFNEGKYINPCELFSVSDLKTGIIRKSDLTPCISLLAGIIPLSKENPKKQLSLLLDECYAPYVGKKLQDLKHTDWFVLSDVKKKLLDNMTSNKYDELDKVDMHDVKLALDIAIKNYGYLYDCHTNVDIDLNQSVRFDIAFLKDENNDELVASYLTLIMNYLQRGININEKYNTEKEGAKDKNSLIRPARFLRIVFDEWSKYLKYRFYLECCDSMMKQARKARTGMMFAVHSINDIEKDNEQNGDLIKSIFKLCATKIIGECDADSIKGLKKYIPVLSPYDVKKISGFKKGARGERDFMAVNDRKEKIVFTSLITLDQRAVFGGGV